MSADDFTTTASELETEGIKLLGIYSNFVDEVWNTQPDAEFGEIKPHLLEYSGSKSSEKIKSLKNALTDRKAETMIITSPADIAC